jgi:hypothetical protein
MALSRVLSLLVHLKSGLNPLFVKLIVSTLQESLLLTVHPFVSHILAMVMSWNVFIYLHERSPCLWHQDDPSFIQPLFLLPMGGGLQEREVLPHLYQLLHPLSLNRPIFTVNCRVIHRPFSLSILRRRSLERYRGLTPRRLVLVLPVEGVADHLVCTWTSGGLGGD